METYYRYFNYSPSFFENYIDSLEFYFRERIKIKNERTKGR